MSTVLTVESPAPSSTTPTRVRRPILATAAAVIGLRVPGVLVENIDTTAKTLPGFTGLWDRMLADSSSGFDGSQDS